MEKRIIELMDDEGDSMFIELDKSIPIKTVEAEIKKIEEEWREKESPDYLINEILEKLPKVWCVKLAEVRGIKI